jgi:hypothetical protein
MAVGATALAKKEAIVSKFIFSSILCFKNITAIQEIADSLCYLFGSILPHPQRGSYQAIAQLLKRCAWLLRSSLDPSKAARKPEVPKSLKEM